MTDPIRNAVPGTQISPAALKVLDANADHKVTVEELNVGLSQDKVALGFGGVIIPKQASKPVALVVETPSGPSKAVCNAVSNIVDNALERCAESDRTNKSYNPEYRGDLRLSIVKGAIEQLNTVISSAHPAFSATVQSIMNTAMTDVHKGSRNSLDRAESGASALVSLKALVN